MLFLRLLAAEGQSGVNIWGSPADRIGAEAEPHHTQDLVAESDWGARQFITHIIEPSVNCLSPPLTRVPPERCLRVVCSYVPRTF